MIIVTVTMLQGLGKISAMAEGKNVIARSAECAEKLQGYRLSSMTWAKEEGACTFYYKLEV